MVSGQTMQDKYEKMLSSKIVRFKEIYNFGFDHFLILTTHGFCFNREKFFFKSKIQFSGQTLRHTKQLLMNKIFRFKNIHKFCFGHFLITCTFFVLNVKNVIKNQKLNFSNKLCDIQKKYRGTKLFVSKRCTKSYFDHFLIGIIVFLINMKNAIK